MRYDSGVSILCVEHWEEPSGPNLSVMWPCWIFGSNKTWTHHIFVPAV